MVVTAAIDKETGEAYISVSGITHDAYYYVAGFNRRWNFGSHPDGTNFGYSFIIMPNGKASYYDFTMSDADKTAVPSQSFFCKLMG